MKTLAIGQTIEVVRTATDAMYIKAKGIITDIRPNGTIWMDATEVVSRFDKKNAGYSKHPSSCAIAVSQSEIVN